jgi:hypothetical protein
MKKSIVTSLQILFFAAILVLGGCSMHQVSKSIYYKNRYESESNVFKMRVRGSTIKIVRKKTAGEFIEDNQADDYSEYFLRKYEYALLSDTVYLKDPINGIVKPSFVIHSQGKIVHPGLFSAYSGKYGIGNCDYSLNVSDDKNPEVYKIQYVTYGSDHTELSSQYMEFEKESLKLLDWHVSVNQPDGVKVVNYEFK